MASPFTIFRKNQKLLLAGLTLMAMFSFVFLDVLTRFGGGRGGSSAQADDVVVTTSEGALTESDLDVIRRDRMVASVSPTCRDRASPSTWRVLPCAPSRCGRRPRAACR
jgi:hypothetical protein